MIHANAQAKNSVTAELQVALHAERDSMTVGDLALQIVRHDQNHLEQVRKILGE